MNKESQNQGQGLAGTEPYGSVGGARSIVSSHAPYHNSNVEIAPPSGIEYGGVFYAKGLCQAITLKDIQCKAPKAKSTDYCIGHLARLNKLGESPEEGPEEGPEEISE